MIIPPFFCDKLTSFCEICMYLKSARSSQGCPEGKEIKLEILHYSIKNHYKLQELRQCGIGMQNKMKQKREPRKRYINIITYDKIYPITQ